MEEATDPGAGRPPDGTVAPPRPPGETRRGALDIVTVRGPRRAGMWRTRT